MNLDSPEAQIAQHFMRETKGIRDAEPYDVDKLDDQPCWYFYYELPQGKLELEVFYDALIDDWKVSVTAFPVAI